MSPSSFLFGEYMNDDLEAWLALQTKQVNRNVTIVTRGENDGPLLHISPDNSIKNFIPRLPENRTDKDGMSVPRVCVSRDLISAVLAHGRMHYAAAVEGVWRYYIYAFDWDVALTPTNAIAGIAEHMVGSELWLVNYNKDHVYIKGRVIGELQVISVLTSPAAAKDTEATIVLHCVLKTKEDIDFYQENKLIVEKGQAYRFVFDAYTKKYNKYNDDTLKFRPIAAEQYSDELARAKKPRSVKELQL